MELRTDIHCVTRWSRYDVQFSGVSLAALVELCQPESTARFVSFVARSERDHSSSMPLDEALAAGTMLALSVDGQPLPPEHGGPLRGVVPGKYFYKSVKWIERIDFLDTDRLGYWEAHAGYHNGADPWLEQRYIASRIDRRTAARLMASRDFSGQDLLGLDAHQRDLQGLSARGAILRNANFSEARLSGADFRTANLSNASFRGSDLRDADFSGADLEGADFASSDLRGADLRGTSLFGATFAEIDPASGSIISPAWIDGTTQVDAASLERVTDVQREFLEASADRPADGS
jgi:hypothetical protein